ncbi:TMEM165/GDT1 family protein [Sphingobium sp. AN641]|uniref:TMEM165/GDT1 family protein n=1 Tax=Sphingobium sp. AN641 TaxID=3133443 RepID=UPI0030BD4DFB
MDALLTALMGCLLGEMGDKSQLLLLALATRFNRNRAVIAGAAVAAIANAAISATAGAVIAPMLGADARTLFAALAVLFLGVGLLVRVKQPDTLDGWNIGAFLTTALGLFILGFGDGPQFLILGITTRTADPLMAGIGGAIGIFVAQLPVILLRHQFAAALPLRAIRIGGAITLLLVGAVLALTALALV